MFYQFNQTINLRGKSLGYKLIQLGYGAYSGTPVKVGLAHSVIGLRLCAYVPTLE